MKTLLSASALLISSFVATSAFAQSVPNVPPEVATPLDDASLIPSPAPTMASGTGDFDCTSGSANIQYEMGFRANYLSIWQIWVGSGMDRHDLSNFIDKAGDVATATIQSGIAGLDPKMFPAHNSVGCRLWGALSGVQNGVNAVVHAVSGSCSAEGRYLADFFAKSYCETVDELGPYAVALAFTRDPDNRCGNAFEGSCDSIFASSAQGYVTKSGRSCGDFLKDEYKPGFESVAHNQCTYVELP